MTKPAAQHRSERLRFHDTAVASGLLDDAQLAAAEKEIGLVIDARTADPEAWDRAVSERLVSQGLLTPFQAREMLAGRRRFRLGQYTVLDEIGKGGMGQVFRAEHAMMGREVAVKVLPRAKSTPESEAAFRREMRMLGRLDHENLVRAYDAGYDAMVSYLVTELVPGMDLKQHVQTHGPLGEAAAASVIAQAARGLAHAHDQGLVHRDVKPGNLLVMQDGRVKVLDLGLAGSQLEEESSRIGRIVGTMDYIAPEQIRMPDDVGPSADIYALGCTAYYAVTGRVPFPGGSRKEKMHRHLTETPDSVRLLAPHLSDAFCKVIEDMMVKSSAGRIGSAAEVVERLRPWLPEGQGAFSKGVPALDSTAARSRDAIRPPPLPTAAGSGAAERSSTLSGVSDFTIQPAVEAGAWGMKILKEIGLPRLVGITTQALFLAVPVGLAFGWAMDVVRSIDPERFASLLRGTTPARLGWTAFLILFALQTMLGTTSRRSR
ncbi:MAG: serine/threonine protein kinase [Planctomycetia bacterium]|nr:serine/threonine protein kinase [Planctomycetia bacterium]